MSPRCGRRARELFAGWQLNGSAERAVEGQPQHPAGTASTSRRLMSDVREVMFSAGSACASESGKPSRILAAIGLSPERDAQLDPPRLRPLHHRRGA